ncbi:MAG: hypothetical protein WDA20_14315 [Desulfuromonadales bacterium]
MSWQRLSIGDFLWRQGAADDRLGLIVHGRLQLMVETVPGRAGL